MRGCEEIMYEYHGWATIRESASFEGVSFYGATLKNIKGITEANFHSINVGTPNNPTVLLGQDAAKWLEATVGE